MRLGGPPPTPLKTPIVDRSERSLTTVDSDRALFDAQGVKRLYLMRNQLSALPDELTRLVELEQLNLSFNCFDALPECVTQLTSLTELLLCGNRFGELPAGLASLPLVHVDLMSNFMAALPSVVPSLTRLTQLNVRRNRLTALPDAMASLVHLKSLDAGENELVDVPAGVFGAALELLELDHNRLAKLPDALGQCRALRRLAVEQNALKALPDVVGNLAALEELVADDNALQALPSSLGVLSNLRTLRAKRNEIGELTPANVAALSALSILDLTLNKLTSLPGTLGTALPYLHQLLVGGNRLSELPPSIAACTRLRVLSCFGNSKLALLPPGVAELPRLHTLHVAYCPRLESLGLVTGALQRAAVDAAHADQATSVANRKKRAAATLRTLRKKKLATESTANVPAVAADDDAPEQGTAFDNDDDDADADNGDLKDDPLVDPALKGPFRALRELHIAGCSHLPPLVGGDNAALGGGAPSLVELHAALCHVTKQHDDNDDDAADEPGAAARTLASADGALLGALVDATPRLERFDAAYCALRDVEPLARWTGLTRLNLQGNALESVPAKLAECASLEECDLSLNAQLKSVPDALAARACEENAALSLFVDLTPLRALPLQHRPPFTRSERHVFAFAEMLGRRPTQEDALTLDGAFDGETSLFCIFDGHAGSQAAQFCAQRFPTLLRAALAAHADAPAAALRSALAALAKAFHDALDELGPAARHCGTTALALLVTPTAYHVANLGDTRAVLSRGGKAQRLSHDHKPADEEERIRKLGGFVIGKTTQRVNGMLGVPRSIGDFFVKPFVSEEPFVDTVARQADDDFILLACDGVWDELDDQRVIDICKKEETPHAAAIRVRDYAYLTGSEDNISTVLVLLRDEGLHAVERRRVRKKSKHGADPQSKTIR
jgi:serine/threonine protein phosphatase PrpC/Leucine-rich repeat (LRR) protein